MIFRRPPALADWLLDHFGDTTQNAALAGDLLEEFRNGRSAAWYWRQSLRAIATRIFKDAMILKPYLLPVSAAYAVQLAISLTLSRQNAPGEIHAGRWVRFGVYVLLQVMYPASSRLVNRLVVGVSHADTKQMYCAVDSTTPRSTILALAAFQSFYLGLYSYGLCALVFARFSAARLVSYEMCWFVPGIFAPALDLFPSPPEAVETEEEEDPKSPWIPGSEPSLPVVLSNGSIVTLDPQNVAQSVFAAADPELIAIVFGQGRSLEVARRAVWLGSCEEGAESVTLAELADLIDETVADTGNKPNRRDSFWQRLRLNFRGDPA